MLLEFFIHLRRWRVPVSVRELLDLLAAMRARLVFADIEQFYFLARLCLVKDEKYFDRFDQAFDDFFSGLGDWQDLFADARSAEALTALLAKALPQLDPLILARVLAEYSELIAQKRRQQDASGDAQHGGEGAGESAASGDSGGSGRQDDGIERNHIEKEPRKGDPPGEEATCNAEQTPESGEDGDAGEGEGDGGDEGEGSDGERGEGEDGKEGDGENGESGQGSGETPGEGIRDEGEHERQRSATKIWQLREYQDYDPDVELGTRNIKMALRRLRKFARTSAELELDLAGTIRATARNGGLLDIREIPERHNAVKVLMFLDVGGSMDEHIELCAQLFSAARSELKYLEYFYFHNFIYENVWHHNDRRGEDRMSTLELLRKFPSDYKIIFVGDASMGRHEIAEKGGSVEHYNAEPGELWLARFQERFRKIIWLNPVPTAQWADSYSIEMIRRLMDGQMYHLSVEGIEQAMKQLAR